MRFLVFFTVLLLLLGGANLLVYKRAVKEFRPSRTIRVALASLLVGSMVAMIAGRVVARAWLHPLAAGVAGVGSVVQLAVLIATVLLLIERAAAAIVWLAGKLWRRSSEEVSDGPLLARREVLGQAAAGAALAVGATSAGYAGLFGRHDYVVEEVPVRLDRLPRALDGFTIAQLSDIHLGLFVDEREIRAALELVRKARPDAIVLTGDLVDNDPRFADHLGRLARALGDIAPVAAVPGNHDYYAGIGATMSQLHAAGATVLMNKSRMLAGGIALVGVDDLSARRYSRYRGPDLERALAGIPEDAPRVVLCHQPAFFREARERIDLQLSGHTHGGQINLGVRPADLLLPFGYVAGLYRHGEGQLYVNRGFGTAGPPARIGAAPEVSKIVLTV